MEKYIIYGAIILSYYFISSMATTNIMRLLKGSKTKQNNINSYCDHCGHVIPLYQQFPVFSYLLSHGKCKYCGVKIPFLTTAIELTVFITMSVVTILFRFKTAGIALSFLAYETIRILMLVKYGKRQDSFFKEYLIAVTYILIAFLLVLFMSIIASAISQ